MHLGEQAAAGGHKQLFHHKLLLQKDQKTYLIQRKPLHSTRKGYIHLQCTRAVSPWQVMCRHCVGDTPCVAHLGGRAAAGGHLQHA